MQKCNANVAEIQCIANVAQRRVAFCAAVPVSHHFAVICPTTRPAFLCHSFFFPSLFLIRNSFLLFPFFPVQCLVNMLHNKMIFRGFSLVNISFVMTFAIFMMKITLSEWAFFTFICHLFNLFFAATFSISFIMFILLISRCGSHCQNEPSRHPSSTFCRCSSAFSRPDIFMLSDHISSPTHLISHISPGSFPRNQSIPRQSLLLKTLQWEGKGLRLRGQRKNCQKCCFVASIFEQFPPGLDSFYSFMGRLVRFRWTNRFSPSDCLTSLLCAITAGHLVPAGSWSSVGFRGRLTKWPYYKQEV